MNLLMEVHNTAFEMVLPKLTFNLIMLLDLTTNLQEIQRKGEYVKHMWMQPAKSRSEILLNNLPPTSPLPPHIHIHDLKLKRELSTNNTKCWQEYAAIPYLTSENVK